MAEPDRPPLPVYVIHWCAPDWCAQSVGSMRGSTGVRVDITVVDNGQQIDGSLERALPAATRVITMASNVGYTGAANAALADWRARRPEAALCVIAGHDAIVEAGTLEALASALARCPDVGIVGPTIEGRAYGATPPPGASGDLVDVDWVPGILMAIAGECYATVGGFDQRFGSYVEDIDYCRRAREAGWRVAVATATRIHGLGSRSARARELAYGNSLLLSWKNREYLDLLGKACRLTGSAAFHGLSGVVALWRDAERRRASRRRASAEWNGLRRGVVAIAGAWSRSSSLRAGGRRD